MKVAINGFGRIGRLLFRLIMEEENIEVVAINDLCDAKQLAHLLKYDTTQGSYKVEDIKYDNEFLLVGSKKVRVFSETDPLKLPWGALDIDVVLECTGKFVKLEGASLHIESGAKKVVVSAPCKGDVKTIVYNVNDDILDGSEKVISAASCTTNCLAPVLNLINNNFGIKKGYMTTIHAVTNDQVILDGEHKKGIESRRGRAAFMNIIPTSTGAASGIGKVIPSLEGKLDGSAMRVPVGTGSVIDLVLVLNKKVSVDAINKMFKENSNETVHFTLDPIVSSDVIGTSYGAVVDGLLTNVLDTNDGQLVKIVAWYDNEMGYCNQMLRTIKKLK